MPARRGGLTFSAAGPVRDHRLPEGHHPHLGYLSGVGRTRQFVDPTTTVGGEGRDPADHPGAVRPDPRRVARDTFLRGLLAGAYRLHVSLDPSLEDHHRALRPALRDPKKVRWIARTNGAWLMQNRWSGARMEYHFEHHVLPTIPYRGLKTTPPSTCADGSLRSASGSRLARLRALPGQSRVWKLRGIGAKAASSIHHGPGGLILKITYSRRPRDAHLLYCLRGESYIFEQHHGMRIDVRRLELGRCLHHEPPLRFHNDRGLSE